MISLLHGPGFLGTRALLYADVTLVLILLSSGLFTLGWRLILHHKETAHRWVQTAAALLNALAVIVVMIPSFVKNIVPGIPAKLLEGTYGVTFFHGLVGAFGLVLGLFIVLRANGLMPKPLQFSNYKGFMRTSYALYMGSTLIGVILYVFVYVAGSG
ncbi:MAG: hypothetical protein ABFD24_10315 [Anaerolineaceae bacterium]|jgi:uncharacterized membrane protein YozB (DUF420 family)